jgi:hypothetical protein
MPGVGTFFRHCPSCGKRFHVKVVGEKLVGEELVGEEIRPGVPAEFHHAVLNIKSIATSRRDESGVAGPLGAEGDQTVAGSETFQYSFRCQHCGHGWTEEHFENLKFRIGGEKNYTGD